MTLKSKKFRGEFLLIPAFLFLIIIFYIPLGSILFKGLQNDNNQFSLSGITEIIGSAYYRKIILFTFFQALVSTVLSILIGLPGAWVMSHYAFPGKKLIKAIITIPFILPSILVVLGFVLFFGKNGLLNNFLTFLGLGKIQILYSFKAIIIAHIFYNFPIALRIISSLWEKIPQTQMMAAKSLGAGKIRVFRTVTLHQIMPAILTSSMIIFIYCFMSFAIILVLGGGPQLTTVEVEVYRLAKVTLDIQKGSSLALIQSSLTLLFMFIYSSLEKYKSYEEKLLPSSALLKQKLRVNVKSILIIFYFILILILIVAPPFSVVLESFKYSRSRSGDSQFSLYWYKQIFSSANQSAFGKVALTSLKNSLFYALSTVLLTLPVSTLVSWVITRKKLIFPSLTELFFLLPLGISSVILGLSYMRLSLMLPSSFKGSAILVILAHTIIALPLVFKSILSIFRKVKLSLREAALNLGASSFRTFRDIELPLIRAGLLTGATFAFAISIGEMNATLMLSQPGTTTLPISIYRLIGSYKFFGACALGTILMFICLLAFLAIDRFEGFGE